MTLQELVGEFLARREAGGLFLEEHEVLACAVAATRQYLAYGSIAADPDLGLAGVNGELQVSTGEWGVIGPLFELMAERDSAKRLEVSATMIAGASYRAPESIDQDITQYLQMLPSLAFSAECESIGLD